MGKLEIRKPYDPVPRVAVEFDPDEGVTQQSFKEQCDVNNILKKFERTGMLEHAARFAGEYGDFIAADDYHGYMNKVVEAQQMFDQMPAGWRKRFGNDPANFLAFMDDPANEAEMREMGMLPKEIVDDAIEGRDSGSPSPKPGAGVPDGVEDTPNDGAGKVPEGGSAS